MAKQDDSRPRAKKSKAKAPAIAELRQLADSLGKQTGENISAAQVDYVVQHLGMQKGKEWLNQQLRGAVPPRFRGKGVIKRKDSRFAAAVNAKDTAAKIGDMLFEDAVAMRGAVRLTRQDGSPLSAVLVLDGPIQLGFILGPGALRARMELTKWDNLFCFFEGDDQRIAQRRERGEEVSSTPIQRLSDRINYPVGLLKRSVDTALKNIRVQVSATKWHPLIPDDDYIWDLSQVSDQYIVRTIERHRLGHVPPVVDPEDDEEDEESEEKDTVVDAVREGVDKIREAVENL